MLAARPSLASLQGAVRRSVASRAQATDAPAAPVARRPAPLEMGGTVKAEKEPAQTVTASATRMQIVNGKFVDDRWVKGTWDLNQFKTVTGETDWDAVLDVEIQRRALLEKSPVPCLDDDVVNFDTSMIPWWVWVKRFHLPTAEKVNGRAAMLGYVLALWVDQATGVGLAEQQDSFLGKILLHLTIFGCLFIREVKDIGNLKGLLDEATFYDKQWNATWESGERPSKAQSPQ